MSTLMQDLRYGARMLTKQPGFTLAAVLTLSLGIGANSAIFNGVSAFVIRPLAGAAEPERLVVPFEVDIRGNRSDSHSYPDYLDYRARNRTLDGLLTFRLTQAVLGAGEQNDVIYGELVSGNYFDVLGVKAALGRTFAPEEDKTPNTHPVVVISHTLWLNRFASDPAVVGKGVLLNGHQFTVIGVAPPEFQGTKWGLGMDFWAPMMMQECIAPGGNHLAERGRAWLQMLGRLKPGVTMGQAADDLTAVAAQLDREFPNERGRDNRVVLLPESEGRFDEAAGTIKLGSALALGVVGVVLLIVCANLANLLLARGLARRREIAVRLALGAGRWRVVRQLLTESVLLALAGGALGLLLAFWMSDLLLLLAPVLPYRMALNVPVDLSVILFTLLVSLLTGVVFGLAPALQTTKTDLVSALKGEEVAVAGGGRRLTLRNLLVVAQVVLSLVVMVAAGLFVRSFRSAQAIDPGLRADGVVAMTVTPGLLGYDEARGQEFYRRVVERVGALPGVESASLAHTLPLGDSSSSTGPVVAEGRPLPPPGEGMSVMYNTVGPGHFTTLQIPLLGGRDFNEADRRDGRRVIIINETAARRLWPGENPVGKRVSIGRNNPTLREVVGVARDGKYRSLGESPRAFAWFPLSQGYETEMTLLVRAPGEPQAVVGSVREAVRAIDPQLPLAAVKTLRQHLTQALWGPQMGALLASAFGALALLLAGVGLYSVIAYSVGRRTREIGIRLALGAERGAMVRMVAAQGLKLALAGVVAGLPLAFALARVLSSLLYGVSASDPLTFACVALMLALVALLACYVPARRAARVDPMVALRYE
jgi:macrolide transport system ATP-binding/permease protein